MKHDRMEIIWIVDGIRGLLLANNGTDKFPEEFYEQAKELLGHREYKINE